ncbi:hypothetical protein RH831_01080 [Halodesulfurarchaeum sp. HSR-GB]|uniref:hypothetical protein n=1 Tax=Halodesulfurarchaeum sp. HSR-GB TaxID=3074077 RepID=UPI002864CB2D|nr:hypothetical protein [Halodesulfurarchaeum sp. HSR-GB]MDR5655775.1 hypothetical protein [Halodesulfurarchaeum sp. HSR-GB]
MGRTNPTYRDRLDALETDWGPYRRSLRRHEQGPFDRLWEHARAHADASGMYNPADPMQTVLLSICLEQERAIQELTERVTSLEAD